MNQKREKENRKKRMRARKAAALLLIAMTALICLINLLSRDKEFSEKENRMLAQRPELTWSSIESGRFMTQYESYKSDQFAGRNLWVSLKTYADLLSGKRKSNGVFKGKDHYLLEDIKPMQEQTEGNLEAIRDFAAQYPDLPVYMALAPNAANVLSEKLPALAVTEDQEAQFQQIKETLGSGVTWIDLHKALKSHRDEDIYYHTDHHWTTLGAYYGYGAIAQTLELDVSKTDNLKPYAVTGEFNGTLSSTSGYESGYREPIYIYTAQNPEDNVGVVIQDTDGQSKTATFYDASKLEEKDKYALFLGGNYGKLDIRTTADSSARLLLFKDSYANCMLPFLAAHYREIVVIDPRYYYGDISQEIKDYDFDQALFLYNGNTFMEDNSISGVLTNGETE